MAEPTAQPIPYPQPNNPHQITSVPTTQFQFQEPVTSTSHHYPTVPNMIVMNSILNAILVLPTLAVAIYVFLLLIYLSTFFIFMLFAALASYFVLCVIALKTANSAWNSLNPGAPKTLKVWLFTTIALIVIEFLLWFMWQIKTVVSYVDYFYPYYGYHDVYDLLLYMPLYTLAITLIPSMRLASVLFVYKFSKDTTYSPRALPYAQQLIAPDSSFNQMSNIPSSPAAVSEPEMK